MNSSSETPKASPRLGMGVPVYAPGMFSSLRIRDFRFLWVANLLASFAVQMQMVARGWLIYEMTQSPMALTWVMIAFMTPSVVFSLLGGVLADRVPKKRIIMTAQVLNGISTFLIAAIVYSGHVTFWHFIYFGLFNGTVMSVSMPARSSLIPEIVGRKTLVNALALESATFNLSRVIGPAVAGYLIGAFAVIGQPSSRATGSVMFIIAALFFVAVVAVAFLRHEGSAPARGRTTVLSDMGEGFRYLWNEKNILGLLILGFVPMTFGFSATFLMPAFNRDIIGGGPGDLGLLMTAIGIGALMGSLTMARLGDINRKGRLLFLAAYLWAISLAGFSLSDHLWLAVPMGVAMGIFSAVFGALNMSLVQLALRTEIRGRVMSISMMSFGLMPLGVLPVSAGAEWFGIRAALLASAGLLALGVVVLSILFPGLYRIDKGYDEEKEKSGEGTNPQEPGSAGLGRSTEP